MDEKEKLFTLQKSTDTEREVIGEILYQPDLLNEHEIKPVFFTPKFQPIFDAIQKAWRDEGSVDIVILQK